MYSLGKKIKFSRKNKGLKQKDLAKAVKISQAALSEFELDKSVPRDSTLLAIAKRLDDDFGIDWIREALAFKPKMTVDEIVLVVHHWLEEDDGQFKIVSHRFVSELAKINKFFRSLISADILKKSEYRAEIINFDDIDEIEERMNNHTNKQEDISRQVYDPYLPRPVEIIEQSDALHYGNKGKGKSAVKTANLERELEKMKDDPDE